jgi:hypothetical protein
MPDWPTKPLTIDDFQVMNNNKNNHKNVCGSYGHQPDFKLIEQMITMSRGEGGAGGLIVKVAQSPSTAVIR